MSDHNKVRQREDAWRCWLLHNWVVELRPTSAHVQQAGRSHWHVDKFSGLERKFSTKLVILQGGKKGTLGKNIQQPYYGDAHLAPTVGGSPLFAAWLQVEAGTADFR
jgi:hypothetical protein